MMAADLRRRRDPRVVKRLKAASVLRGAFALHNT
jgi:hypothetical protein